MTKSEIFKAAHALAKQYVGNYSACFSLALKEIYKNGVKSMTISNVRALKKGDVLRNTNHGFNIEIIELGKKNTRYINLDTDEKVKSPTSKFNFMLREGVFVREAA